MRSHSSLLALSFGGTAMLLVQTWSGVARADDPARDLVAWYAAHGVEARRVLAKPRVDAPPRSSDRDVFSRTPMTAPPPWQPPPPPGAALVTSVEPSTWSRASLGASSALPSAAAGVELTSAQAASPMTDGRSFDPLAFASVLFPTLFTSALLGVITIAFGVLLAIALAFLPAREPEADPATKSRESQPPVTPARPRRTPLRPSVTAEIAAPSPALSFAA